MKLKRNMQKKATQKANNTTNKFRHEGTFKI